MKSRAFARNPLFFPTPAIFCLIPDYHHDTMPCPLATGGLR